MKDFKFCYNITIMEKDIVKFIKKVIDEKFEAKPQGYDPKQVDKTLDEIVETVSQLINNWNTLCDKYDALKIKNTNFSNTIDEQKKEITMLESKLNKMEASGMSFAIINDRLNAVEKKQSSAPASDKDNEIKK